MKRETIIRTYEPIYYNLDSISKDTVLIVGKCSTFVNYNTIEKRTVLKVVSGNDTITNIVKNEKLTQGSRTERDNFFIKHWRVWGFIAIVLTFANIVSSIIYKRKNEL